MKNLFRINSPYLIFLPFLIFYCLIVFKLHSNIMEGDEGRYIFFAENLCKGFYSPKEGLNLWSGPGYPILLIPFVYFKLPYITITLLNVLFQYFSIILLFKSLKGLVSEKIVWITSFVWACYYISYQELSLILTETFTIFLLTYLLYLVINLYKSDNRNSKKLVWIGCIIGYIALTKVIFGYVILLLLLFSFVFYLFNKKTKHVLFISLIALAFNIPYLVYTYSLTNKFFYWSNSGGMSLYWMSTPFDNEHGDWNNVSFDANCSSDVPCNKELLKANHQKDFDFVYSFSNPIDQDNAFKSIAYKNIKSKPVKFLKNCLANLSRMLFGIPASMYYQKWASVIRIPPNAILLAFILISSILTIINFRKISIYIFFILSIVFIYLGLSTFVSAYPRMFYPVVPILLFWIAFIIDKTIVFKRIE